MSFRTSQINPQSHLFIPAAQFNFTNEERDTLLGGDLSLAYFTIGAPCSLLIGFLADKMDRIKLLLIIVLLGEGPCFCTIFVTAYWQLVILRACTGIAAGGALPLMYSLLGDLFSTEQRGFASSLIAISTGAGIVVGQMMSGIIGPALGWKVPYCFTSAPNIVIVSIIYFTIKEPKRGVTEKAMSDVMHEDNKNQFVYSEKINWTSFKQLFFISSNRLAFAQALPGTVPWGFINVFLNNYLSDDKGFGTYTATLAITCFGVGAVLGVIGGGMIGQIIYNKSRKLFCIFLAIVTAGGMPCVWMIVLLEYKEPGLLALAFLLGLIASITGPNVRVIVLNVNTPETRGTAFAFFNLADDIGKGLGPAVVAWLLVQVGNRKIAFSCSALFWALASLR